MQTLGIVSDVNVEMADYLKNQPEIKTLTLEGVSIDL